MLLMMTTGSARHCAGKRRGTMGIRSRSGLVLPCLVKLLLLSACRSQKPAGHTLPAPLLRGTVPSPGNGTKPVAERIAWTWNATDEALASLPLPASMGRVRVSGGVLTNVVDETIYVGAEGNRVYALIPRTGEVMWRATLPLSSRASEGPVRLEATSRDGSLVFALCPPFLYALHANTGQVLWRAGGLEGASYPAAASEDKVLLLLRAPSIPTVEPAPAEKGPPAQAEGPQGDSASLGPPPPPSLRPASSPVGGWVVRALDTLSGSTAWHTPLPSPPLSPPTPGPSSSGGEGAHPSPPWSGARLCPRSLASDGSSLYVLTPSSPPTPPGPQEPLSPSLLWLCRLDTETGAVAWSVPVASPSPSSAPLSHVPAAVVSGDHRAVFATCGVASLCALSAHNGYPLWHYTLPSSSPSSSPSSPSWRLSGTPVVSPDSRLVYLAALRHGPTGTGTGPPPFKGPTPPQPPAASTPAPLTTAHQEDGSLPSAPASASAQEAGRDQEGRPLTKGGVGPHSVVEVGPPQTQSHSNSNSHHPIPLATPALLAEQQQQQASSSSSSPSTAGSPLLPQSVCVVVLALDVASGRVRWSYGRSLSLSPLSPPSPLMGPADQDKEARKPEADDASATPITLGISPEGGRVYVRVSGTGEVDSLDALSGRHLWAYKPPTIPEARAEAAEPAFTSDGSVILHHADQILYLDASM